MKSHICIMVLAALALAWTPALAVETIYDIQSGAVPEGTIVDVRNVVVTGVGFYGFYAQEVDEHPTYGRQYSGIWVYTSQDHTCHKGDLVNIYGLYKEYFGFSEIDLENPAHDYTVVGSAPIPDPVPVRIDEICNDAAPLAEAYEGVLVRIDRDDNTLFSLAPNAFDEWWVVNEQNGYVDSMMIAHENAKPGDDFEYDTPPAGTELSFVQGPLKYSYNNYKIVPRDCPTDIGGPCAPNVRGAYSTSTSTMNVQFGVDMDPVTAGDPNNYLLASGYFVFDAEVDAVNPKLVRLVTEEVPNGDPDQIIVSGVQSSDGVLMTGFQTYDFRSGITSIYQIQYVPDPSVNDLSPLQDEVVTVQGRVTAVDGNYYWLQDGDGGPWDGLYCRVAKNGPVAVGDEVQVSGRVTEYFNSTQLNFRSGVNNWVNFGPSADPVVVNTVTADMIPYRLAGKLAEPYEHVLVKLEEATLDSLAGEAGPYFNEWLLFQSGLADTAACDLEEIAFAPGFPVAYDPCIGNIVDMTGILNYAFNEYRICPRSGVGGDIVEIYTAPGCPTTGIEEHEALLPFTLEQNRPNPFAPGTVIAFRLNQEAEVSLEVMDVSGRRVRTLASGPMGAGEHNYRWDGLDQTGHPVAAGTYFYRLRSDGQEMSRKMVLVQ